MSVNRFRSRVFGQRVRSSRVFYGMVLGVALGYDATGQAWANTAASSPTGSVSIYGFLKADVEHVRATGGSSSARVLSTQRLSNNQSVLGFRASEDLSGGVRVWAQLETHARVDTGAGPWGGRNSAVGLATSMGEVIMGLWEAPLRYVSVYAVDPFAASAFASNSIMGNGFATAANGVAAASFDRRMPNVLQYWSPKWAQFEMRLAYSMPEERIDSAKPSMWGALLTHKNGALFAAWGYEQHRSYNFNGSRDDAHRVAAAYTLGATRLRASVERLRYQPLPGKSLARTAWQVAMTQDFTPRHQVMASYVRAQSPKGDTKESFGGIGIPGADGGARQFSIGYLYRLSKRTDLWVAHTRVTNGATSHYNLSTNPISGMEPGQDPSATGLGVTHRF